MSAPTIYREPGEETVGLYPGLVVCDGRVTGSITVGRSRLPLWAIPVRFTEWEEYATPRDAINARDGAMFVHHLLEQRGEFARLLLLLANAERLEGRRGGAVSRVGPWWYTKRHRRRVAAQLRRCLRALGEAA